jgi:hypothetical protein
MSIIHNTKYITSVFIWMGWNVTIQHLQRVNILAIMEQTITTLFAQVLMVRHVMLTRAFLLLQQAE